MSQSPIPYLDSLDYPTADPAHMAALMKDFPGQLTRAWQETESLAFPHSITGIANVVLCGMGGSGIGGELATALPPQLQHKPVAVWHDYGLPAWANQTTLVVVTSYSGDTEETLSNLREAQQRGCQLFVVSGGGALAKRAQEDNLPSYRFTYPAPPRESLGYLLAPLLRVLIASGSVPDSEKDFSTAIDETATLVNALSPDQATERNQAKQLAYALYDRLPVIVAGSPLAAVARRWKCQLNENAKTAGVVELLPEANHNTVEGFAFPVRTRDDMAMVLLSSDYYHNRIAERLKLLEEFLGDKHVVTHIVRAPYATTLWSELMSLVSLGGWTSYYLALLNRINPEPVTEIAKLKSRLREL